MIFDLLHAPFPEGYGEEILRLDECKVHLRVDGEDEDVLIGALRDAAIDFVERYCSIKLMVTEGMRWVGSRFPLHITRPVRFGIEPVREITGVTWLSLTGETIERDPASLRVTPSGDILPGIGTDWPSMVAGDVVITFTAGYDAGEAPPSLLSAVRLFLGHLYKNREAVISSGDAGEVPLGVRQLCSPFRRIVI